MSNFCDSHDAWMQMIDFTSFLFSLQMTQMELRSSLFLELKREKNYSLFVVTKNMLIKAEKREIELAEINHHADRLLDELETKKGPEVIEKVKAFIQKYGKELKYEHTN